MRILGWDFTVAKDLGKKLLEIGKGELHFFFNSATSATFTFAREIMPVEAGRRENTSSAYVSRQFSFSSILGVLRLANRQSFL